MKVVCIGSNCGASHIAQELPNYAGCSPTDWTMNSIPTVNRILACLYTYEVTKVIDKYYNFDLFYNNSLDSIEYNSEGVNNYNSDFEFFAPHHVRKKDTKEDSDGVNYYTYEKNTREKISRRFNRLLELLTKEEEELLFLFAKTCDKRDKLREQDIHELSKLFNLICLFRKRDTFRIAYIDTVDNSECKDILSTYNIDYFIGPTVTEERFWILPCVEMLKKFYDL